MPNNILQFETMAGAIIQFDLDKCEDCDSKACIKADHLPLLGPVLELKNNIPSLIWSKEEIKKGKCTDCVACELACHLYGNKGVTITYEILKLNEYISELELKNVKPVYKI